MTSSGANGVDIFTGERVVRLLGAEKVEGIVTDQRTISCEMVIMAAGMRPNSELAREAGIGVAARGGIIVDQRMATSAPDIYACGDCVEAPDLITGAPGMIQLWHNAKEQGEVAGSNAAGVPAGLPVRSILRAWIFSTIMPCLSAASTPM